MIIIYSAMLITLLVVSIIDIKKRLISINAIYMLLLGGAAAIAFNRSLSLANGVIAMLTVFSALWIIHHLSKGSLGMGDAKLCAVVSLYLGIEKSFGMLTLSIILCGTAAIIMVIVDKSNKNKSLPFSPFVAAGTLAVLIMG